MQIMTDFFEKFKEKRARACVYKKFLLPLQPICNNMYLLI